MKYHTLFLSKLGKISQNLSSAAVVIGALRVKITYSNLDKSMAFRLLYFAYVWNFQTLVACQKGVDKQRTHRSDLTKQSDQSFLFAILASIL